MLCQSQFEKRGLASNNEYCEWMNKIIEKLNKIG